VLILFQALLGLFSVMTYVERRVLAFMQFRLGPTARDPSASSSPWPTASSCSSRKS
jgi:NADH:ubiquinone oxidoreductase subunit H